MDGNRTIVADLQNQSMKVYERKVPIHIEATQDVIDLDTNGRRWEGGVNNGKPFGFGVIYDEEGRKEYEGFMMDGMKSCYGIEYYSDIDRVKFEGCYYYNNRFGKGTLYDRNQTVEYSGLWKNDKPYISQFDGQTIDNYTESIEIQDNSFNSLEFFVLHSYIHSLKRIVIGDECFQSVQLFELDGLAELESVVIGLGDIMDILGDDEECVARAHGACRFFNCPKLISIRIGGCTFSNYRSLELKTLSSLQSIDIGYNCFHYASSFSLTG